MGVKRLADRLIAVKLVLEKDKIDIISAYPPQLGFDESGNRQFWEELDGLIEKLQLVKSLEGT